MENTKREQDLMKMIYDLENYCLMILEANEITDKKLQNAMIYKLVKNSSKIAERKIVMDYFLTKYNPL